jgi:hypothetical protein
MNIPIAEDRAFLQKLFGSSSVIPSPVFTGINPGGNPFLPQCPIMNEIYFLSLSDRAPFFYHKKDREHGFKDLWIKGIKSKEIK